MLCISINQESRRLALFDMYNAAPQCDLLEMRLDRFGKSPEIGELLSNKPKPVIMCCRRPEDGGYWDGTEEERRAPWPPLPWTWMSKKAQPAIMAPGRMP